MYVYIPSIHVIQGYITITAFLCFTGLLAISGIYVSSYEYSNVAGYYTHLAGIIPIPCIYGS